MRTESEIKERITELEQKLKAFAGYDIPERMLRAQLKGLYFALGQTYMIIPDTKIEIVRKIP